MKWLTHVKVVAETLEIAQRIVEKTTDHFKAVVEHGKKIAELEKAIADLKKKNVS